MAGVSRVFKMSVGKMAASDNMASMSPFNIATVSDDVKLLTGAQSGIAFDHFLFLENWRMTSVFYYQFVLKQSRVQSLLLIGLYSLIQLCRGNNDDE